jgi:hypothetical protein
MSHPAALQATSQVTGEVVREILSAIENLRYGSVEIVVHDGRVTQIEKREKVRFGQEASQQR